MNDANEALEKGTSPPLDLDLMKQLRRMRKPYPTQKRTGKFPSK